MLPKVANEKYVTSRKNSFEPKAKTSDFRTFSAKIPSWVVSQKISVIDILKNIIEVATGKLCHNQLLKENCCF